MGTERDVQTLQGEYDGYSVELNLFTNVPQGDYGQAILTGHGSRPIVVRKKTRRADGMLPSGAPHLSIDAIMMYPTDPRGPDFGWGFIDGLDYTFMQRQGWLFPCNEDNFDYILCRPETPSITISSYKRVDAAIQYLGRWLKDGNYGGKLFIDVWRPKGSAADVHTLMGEKDGYSVEWAHEPGIRDRTVVAITSRGAYPLPPVPEGKTSTYLQVGPPSEQWSHWVRSAQAYPPSVLTEEIASYADMDEAILTFGRLLQQMNIDGTMFIYVIGPQVYTLD
ncbi:hypothetical protein KRR26_35910 [Corallococcus sp. M34]|uniref:hypothetical protein n=1 Tax=Citreicoccus inhibens TaxID=2849499 RepID=UPI001C24E83D|nr:hypothetical protein [Citreicoccus inhibens]MBU8900995.1 hypothetical protein [Citreicoccus inhibens]